MKIMRSLLLLIFILSMLSGSFAQNIRYKDVVFDKIDVQKNLLYSMVDTIEEKYRQFDLYQPANDEAAKQRPLVIWMHGGGFKYGSKNAKEIKIWSDEFAKRGYVFAAVNYRLSKNHPISKFPDLVAGCYDGVDDITTATKYFKANAYKFNIDTSRIILGGNSAGALIALQTVYSNRADLQNVIDSNKIIANTGDYNSLRVAAVINFWGALFDKDWLRRTNVPIVSVCGSKDKLVPVTTKGVAFFGSVDIHKKADALHIANDIKVYNDYGHELQKHFNPFFRSGATKKRWKEAAEFSAKFIANIVLMRK